MSEITSDLDRAAKEIRQQGISGWGNTCEEAAQHIRELENLLARVLVTGYRGSLPTTLITDISKVLEPPR